MKLAELSPEVRDKIKSHSWNKTVGAHATGDPWGFMLDYYRLEIADIEGYQVLLPMQKERFASQTIQRCIPSADGNTLTLFFQDLSYGDDGEPLFLAICDKLPDEDLFLTTALYESSFDDTLF